MSDVLTNRGDNTRTGAYLEEKILDAANVNVTTFGKLFSRTVDGDLYAQPLIVSGVDFGKRGVRNVVFLATSRNWVYAYDADVPKECLPLWQVNLGTPVPREDIFKNYTNFGDEIGITSTPVIDLRKGGKGPLYVVAKTRVEGEVDPAKKEAFEYKIHALDLRTGRPFKFGGRRGAAAVHNPTRISAMALDPMSGRTAEFNPKWHLNRPGLLLLDGVLYLAFGSQGDEGEFWGWIMAYDARTLTQLAVHCTALAWGEGGVWQSGCGLAGESVTGPDGKRVSYVYAVVGNGQKPIPEIDDGVMPKPHIIPDRIDVPFYGNSILKLTLVKSDEPPDLSKPPQQGDPKTPYRFEIADWFTTSDCLDLNEIDQDLIGGPLLFTAQAEDGREIDMVLGGGKDGKFYLADRHNLGKWQPMTGPNPYHIEVTVKGQLAKVINVFPYEVTDSDIQASHAGQERWVRWEKGQTHNRVLQDDPLCKYHIHGAPVLWSKSKTDVTAYVWSEKDFCKAFKFRGGKFDTLLSKSLYGLPPDELRMPGGILALSADGTKDGTGIVWASHPTDADGMNKTVKGTLRAFDARDISVELWTSDKNPDGDDRLGDFAKFCPPVVANGKVYMATFSRQLVVYGLLPAERERADSECDIWKLRGIGGNVHGSCKFSCARYHITTTGQGLATPDDPEKTPDSFYFPHVEIDSLEQPVLLLTARLVGVSVSASDPKQQPEVRAGIMMRAFREDLATATYAAMVYSPEQGTLFQRRLADNAKPVQNLRKDSLRPNWLRLSCQSAESPGFLRFKGEVSADGLNWQQLGPLAEIQMGGIVWTGLVATVQTGRANTSSTDKVEASFSDVVLAPRP